MTDLAASDALRPERAFDFWLGDWEVRRPDGSLAGHNRIVLAHQGRVLREQYRTERGYSGESLNIYDSTRQCWHQSWVDSDGLLLLLEGGWQAQERCMQLQGTAAAGAAPPTLQRIRWTPQADGTVRQCWECSSEAGAAPGAWELVFDGLYRRVAAA
ncbi:hypothetical protein [Paucibacter soli]|uniref:hypothetical protein n=1 Tax=Paucibacter soli TaxID=3133433 RepID=UPI0030A2B56D